jgi:hypothetical protein
MGGFSPPWTRGQGEMVCTSSRGGAASEHDRLGSVAHWLSPEVHGEGEEDTLMLGEPSPESRRRQGSDAMVLKCGGEWSTAVARMKHGEGGEMWGKRVWCR